MTRGISLHLGLNRVDPSHYGSPLPLRGCHGDAKDMADIARKQGFSTNILLDATATAQRVLHVIGQAARDLKSGDAFLLTYAGHGAQVPDRGREESDGLDETWLLFDRMLLDDEIHTALARFVSGVRILAISDSCHSGTITRQDQYQALVRSKELAPLYGDVDLVFRTPAGSDFGACILSKHEDKYAEVRRSIATNARDLVTASVIQISGCNDDELAADGPSNGLFTSRLKQAWRDGAFTGTHRGLWQAISREMPKTQRPSYLVLGTDTASFERQRPFTVSSVANDRYHTTSGGMSMSTWSNESDGNWSDVCAELEKRFQGRGPSSLFQDLAAANSQTAIETFTNATGLTLPQAPAGGGGWRDMRAPSGPPIAHAFWWGFRVEVSSPWLEDLKNAADPIIDIIRKIGTLIGPVAPWIALVAAFIAGALQLIERLDQGRGVYVSMSWFAPGIFVPTSL